ncbi:hypothetical protein M5362_07295 [Streptomyces sp. Je 1-79]|uniref:hypothetical protein n=1 Tax=Streptomyces sp. Je 1-79 TaxID=2943847 RepID=UPI0021A5AE66|nr:hypothetical protein [Streptomyces sp. Je 1-79]MCT4352933.1 hypothetical protein [Streptomyces sp. Je 1-79]
MPIPPPPAPLESNPAQAVLVGLLNLSCLGLGYALLKQWIPAAVCWVATVVLLLVALPADVDGIPTGVLVGYGVFLLAAAADGARRGLRAPLALGGTSGAGASGPGSRAGAAYRRLALPLALGLVLLAVPVGGSVAYGAARDEAVEQSLLARLAEADKQVKSVEGQSFGGAEHTYRKALAVYQELGTKHAGSRAGRLVPDRLTEYYASVSAPYGQKKYCEAVPGLQHLRALPERVDRSLLDGLTGKADDPLAHSWYECGVAGLGGAGTEATAGEHLNALQSTFPQSPYAGKVEPAVREALTTRATAISAGDACAGVVALRRFDTSVDLLQPKATFASVARDTDKEIQKGDFSCGVEQFEDKEYTEAVQTMTEYAEQYPDSPQTAHAKSIAIAAEIADETPAAGKRLPSATAPGGSRMVMVVSNDGPGEVELLYTGPVTGRVTLKACGSCTAYAGSLRLGAAKPKVCTGPSSKYPKATLTLPAGDYHFLQKRSGSAGSLSAADKSSTAKIEPGYSYTNCLYVTSGFGF